MTDALVKELNRRGYQPLFLARTGVTPPELYSWAPTRGRLVRRSHLTNYVPKGTDLTPRWDRMPDIEHQSATSKKQDASISFLKKALACIGIDGVPKLDLSFTGRTSLTFRFTDIRVASFDNMDRVVRDQLSLDAIPPEVVEEGDLHVAYEYLYARELLMSREDQQAFEHDVGASLQTHVDIGSKGKVEFQSSTTLSFSSTSTDRVAFACKFGQLVRRDNAWYFFPEEGKMGPEGRMPIVPARGVVLLAEPGN